MVPVPRHAQYTASGARAQPWREPWATAMGPEMKTLVIPSAIKDVHRSGIMFFSLNRHELEIIGVSHILEQTRFIPERLPTSTSSYP